MGRRISSSLALVAPILLILVAFKTLLSHSRDTLGAASSVQLSCFRPYHPHTTSTSREGGGGGGGGGGRGRIQKILNYKRRQGWFESHGVHGRTAPRTSSSSSSSSRQILPPCYAASPPPAADTQFEAEEGLKAMQQSLQKLNPEILEAGGLVVASQPESGKEMFRDLLDGTYLMVDFDRHPELRLLNVEPPVIKIPGFLTSTECDALIADSKRGADSGQVLEANDRYETVLPEEGAKGILNKIKNLFPFTQQWEKSLLNRPQTTKTLSFEQARVLTFPPAAPSSSSSSSSSVWPSTAENGARLEDALPLNEAFDNSYQRRAKIRIELSRDLNEPPEVGGRTYYNGLQIHASVTKGDAIVTFPAYRNSLPDSRMIYTDEPPQEGKTEQSRMVFETWVTARLERMKQMQKDSGTKFVQHPAVRSMQKEQKNADRERVKEKEKRPSLKALKKANKKKSSASDSGGGFGSPK